MLIVDDHAIVREGLKQIAANDPEIVVAGEAATGAEAIARAAEETFDVVVLDLSLPDHSGLEVLSRLIAADPARPVLILSMEREEEFALRALRAGAAGYIEKRSAPAQLIAAIKRVAQGKKFISGEMTERLLTVPGHHGTAERPHDLLSPREFEIFLAIAAGKRVSLVAVDLGLSVKTVNNHRARILQKLGLKTTADLIRYALRNKLVD